MVGNLWGVGKTDCSVLIRGCGFGVVIAIEIFQVLVENFGLQE